MLNIAVCDDNKPMLDFFSSKIDEIFNEIEMDHEIFTFLTGEEFLEKHKERPFDIVFLDIVMPGINGFEAAKQIRKESQNTYIIFITSEISLVYDSFDFQPFYFIPKSRLKITEDKLKSAINKLSEHMAASEKVIISGAYESKKLVSPNEILYVKSSLNNIEYHLTSGKIHIVRGKLNNISPTLNPYFFARTHNRIIVNMLHIDTVDYPNMEIQLDNSEVIGISRTYKKNFDEAYLMFMKNHS